MAIILGVDMLFCLFKEIPMASKELNVTHPGVIVATTKTKIPLGEYNFITLRFS